MDNMKHRRLQELDRSDFAIVDGDPDIRGWDVKISSGQTVGEVDELILDAREKKVRYMVVGLHEVGELNLVKRKVLIPIGLAELDTREDDVLIPRITAPQLMNLPEYEEDRVTPEVERQICLSLGRDFNKLAEAERNRLADEGRKEEVKEMHLEEPVKNRADTEDDNEEVDPEFYRHEYYNLDTLYKNRMHEAKTAGNESEYDRGLKLWEKRSEGGIIEEGRNREKPAREREVNEEARMEMVRNRRDAYERRRFGDGGERNRFHERKDNTIIGRIKNEGLRDA